MKIAYVHTGLWPSASPSMTFTTYNAVGMAEAGVECHFFIQRNSPDRPEDTLLKHFNTEMPDNLTVHPVSTNPVIKSNSFYFRKVMGFLKELVDADGLDGVISRAAGFLPFLAEFRQRYNIPVFYETHDFFADLALRNDGQSRVKLKNQQLERKYIPAVSGIICLQHSQEEQYKKCFPATPVWVARTGIHRVTRRTGTGDRLGYIGSLDKHKGVAALIKAAARSESKPKIVIIGGKNDKEIREYYGQAECCYERDKVEITGWVPRAELEKYLRQIRIGAVPLADTFFNRYLTSPLKLFDFYSFGIPVICPDLPTMRELVEENATGLFYPPGQIGTMAQQIDTLMEDDGRYGEMAEQVLAKAENLLWAERARRLVKMIRECEHSG